MNFIKETGHFESSDGVKSIAYYVYRPENTETRAVMQISHGMCEYIERYEDLADFLCKNGIAVCGNDHLGHGASVSSDDDLGYFGPEGGWTYLPKDLHRLTAIMQEEFEGIPYIMFGHSMGSFAARAYAAKYGRCLDGLILCGTSGGEPAADAGLALAKSLAAVKGGHYRSEKIQQMFFGISNFKVEGKRTEFDWVSRDKEMVAKYMVDPKCNFTFTVRGYYDLIMLLEYVSSDEWAGRIKKDLPIFIISGDMDPVGGYGKGVKKVYDRLVGADVRNVSMKLYEGARHELVNEINRSEVYADILGWINGIIE